MTEEEWLQSDDRFQMTYFVAERMSLRKLRLAEVAVCRRVQHHLVDQRSRHALKVSEAYADGLVSDEVLAETRSHAKAAYQSQLPHNYSARDVHVTAALYVVCAVGTEFDMRMQVDMIDIALFAPKPPPDWIPLELRTAHVAEAELVRDVFGNPFRPVALDPDCLTPPVKQLATAIYDDRTFDRLPILADALEEAGCNQEEVLQHLRSGGEHVRGCWALDLVLGKS